MAEIRLLRKQPRQYLSIFAIEKENAMSEITFGKE
jgi:hypothetical protein